MSSSRQQKDALDARFNRQQWAMRLFLLHAILSVLVILLAVFGSSSGLLMLDTATAMAVIITISLILHALHFAVQEARRP